MLDAIYLSFDLAWTIMRKRSFRLAAQHISQKRFHDTTPETERNSMGKLQENVAFTTCAFSFGVIPRVIKLYAKHMGLSILSSLEHQ